MYSREVKMTYNLEQRDQRKYINNGISYLEL